MLARSSQIAPAKPSPRAASPVRDAAIDFVRGTAFGWGRRELASWLVCQYSPCLVVDAAVHPDRSRALADNVTTALLPIEDELLERLILDARCSTLKLLADLPWPTEAEAHTRAARAAGHVVSTCDARGRRRWAPVGRRRMRLADRVASLFVADYLDTPSDYRITSLCRACGELVFGPKAEHQARCEHARDVA